jgi:hypothetical protein
MRPCTNKNSPLGIILVAKDDAAERILFMYPFDHNETDPQTSFVVVTYVLKGSI